MVLFKKTIFTGFAPNMTGEDLLLACRFLFSPYLWRKLRRGACSAEAEEKLRAFFSVREATLFDSGRSALLASLLAVEAGKGSEVLVQAYTCVAVVNAIREAGATPVFTDVEKRFFMSPKSAAERITHKTKAIIIQHTFGLPADLPAMIRLAREKGVAVIEDCAHTFGGKFGGRLLGTFGDIGMLSFGSDKAISCVRGGAALTNNPAYAHALRSYGAALPAPSRRMVLQHLFQCLLFAFGRRFWHAGAGKAALFAGKTLHLLPRILTEEEKKGKWDRRYPTRLPNALACLLTQQIALAPKANVHRARLSRYYRSYLVNQLFAHPDISDEAPLARYPIIANEPARVRAYAKKHGIILGDWYDDVVAPMAKKRRNPFFSAINCPEAERSARGSVNLPTDIHITLEDAKRIAQCLNEYGHTRTR